MNWEFDHLAFTSGNGEGLEGAFSRLLGLSAGPRPPFPFPGRWLYQDKNAIVHVLEQEGQAETRLHHIALRTDASAEQVLDHISKSGLAFHQARVPENNTVQFFVQLPGLLLELDAAERRENTFTSLEGA